MTKRVFAKAPVAAMAVARRVVSRISSLSLSLKKDERLLLLLMPIDVVDEAALFSSSFCRNNKILVFFKPSQLHLPKDKCNHPEHNTEVARISYSAPFPLLCSSTLYM